MSTQPVLTKGGDIEETSFNTTWSCGWSIRQLRLRDLGAFGAFIDLSIWTPIVTTRSRKIVLKMRFKHGTVPRVQLGRIVTLGLMECLANVASILGWFCAQRMSSLFWSRYCPWHRVFALSVSSASWKKKVFQRQLQGKLKGAATGQRCHLLLNEKRRSVASIWKASWHAVNHIPIPKFRDSSRIT